MEKNTFDDIIMNDVIKERGLIRGPVTSIHFLLIMTMNGFKRVHN